MALVANALVALLHVWSVSRRILMVQALPAPVALAALWLT